MLLPHGALDGLGLRADRRRARASSRRADLRGVEIAIPGELTTAFLVLRMCLGDFRYREVPFDQIIDEVQSGTRRRGPADPRGPADLRGRRAEEGASTWASGGCSRPGCRCRSAPTSRGAISALGTCCELSDVLRDSIQAGLDNREEAMEHALQYGRGLDTELADRFVGMYVNELTCDYGDEGRQAVRELLERAEALGTLRAAGSRRVRRLGRDRLVGRLRPSRRCCSSSDRRAHGRAARRRAHGARRRQRRAVRAPEPDRARRPA